MDQQRATSTVDELNTALRAYRSLPLRLVVIVVLGLGAAIVSSLLGASTGFALFGLSLPELILLATVVLLVVELYAKGRIVATALHEPATAILPLLILLSGMTIIARRATAMGMEWSGFFGPLRPVRRK